MKCLRESIRLTIPVCAAILSLAILPAAHAGLPSASKEVVGSVRVTYADLDLTQEGDVQLLLERIEKAAYRACGGDARRHPSYRVIPRYTVQVFKECREDAAVRAIGAIDMPVVSQARVEADGK